MKEKNRRLEIQDSLQNIDQVVDYLNASIELNDKDFLPMVIADAVIALTRIAHSDPYAERSKWIGKLCRFWNDEDQTDIAYEILTSITDNGKYFSIAFGCEFDNCEPITADDKLIYKGE